MASKKGLMLVFGTAIISGFSIFVNSYAIQGTNAPAFVFLKNLLVALMLFAYGWSESPGSNGSTGNPSSNSASAVPVGSVEEPGAPESPTPTEDGAQQAKPQAQGIAEDVKALFAKRSKITSMRYLYYGPPNDALGYEVSVVGKKAKVLSPKQIKADSGRYYDTIYLDLEAKSATGYCESASCPEKGPFSSDFQTYSFKTPTDFIGMVTSAESKGTELFESRKAVVVAFRDSSGKEGVMSLDSTYGVPLKIVYDGKKYEYRSAFFNSLSQADVMPKG